MRKSRRIAFRAHKIRQAARNRVVSEHAYAHRAAETESALGEAATWSADTVDRDAFGTYPAELAQRLNA